MALVVLSGIIISILLIPFGKFFKGYRSILLAFFPLILFCYLLRFIPEVSSGIVFYESYPWVPSMGIDLSFRMDGLSLVFSLLITGIGTLIFLYASSYLKGDGYLDRFFAYLLLFMSAMLGIVLSDNILLLFIFWELTSISSFFLIGFNNDNPDSRKSALIALGVTGLGGFFLFAGMVLLSQIAGSYSIRDLIDSAGIIKDHNLYPWVLVLVFAAAFTKSAQFPFHFWLPGAMKAPTPVSAYLHSATMVKAGIFLLARFTPVLGGTVIWSNTLMLIGGITMVYAVFHSLLRTDLKAVLAYSTIAALGMLTFLIGVGTHTALVAAITFTIIHAFYKACLFLTTGIIDHEAGTRDLRKLSGLRKVMLPVYIAGVLAALSSAGVPLFFGFIGKDLIYEATLNSGFSFMVYLVIAAFLTNAGLIASGFLAGIKPFTGALPVEYQDLHAPSYLMWGPALVLALGGLFFGIFPGIIGTMIVEPGLSFMTQQTEPVSLKLWHGFNTVLYLSIATLFAGVILFYGIRNSLSGNRILDKIGGISPQVFFAYAWSKVHALADWYTNLMLNGFLRSYIIKIIIFAEILLIYGIWQGGPIYIDYSQLTSFSLYEVVCVLILVAAVILTVLTRSRLTAVIGTSVVGYAICLIYVFYSAPDLAITQFTIDTLLVVLFVFVLFNLPSFLVLANRKVIIRDSIVAILFGIILALIAIKVLQIPTEIEVSDFYGKFAYTLAKGKNVVNVILVDFRAVDTMFEIVVLSIAAIGVYSLVKLRLKASEKE